MIDPMSEWVPLAVCATALALLCAVVVISLVFIARSLGSVASEMRRIHLQHSNIIRMMLKAGFRPANGLDWFDDDRETRVVGQGATLDTQFDLRTPGDRQ
jgi:hypothetical protein